MSESPYVVLLPSDSAAADLRTHGGDLNDWQLVVWDGEGDPPERAQDAVVLLGPYLGGPWSASSVESLPRLAVLQVLSAGYDGWLDVLPEGVTLCNGRGVHGRATAELAVLGVLAWRRELLRFWEQQAMERWVDEGKRTGDLDQMTVTVLGAGDIAEHVRDALTVFGAEVTLVGRTRRHGVATLADLDDLLPVSEAVVVALPLTEDTQGLLGAENLAKLPDGAVVVNVGRGPVVDTEALRAELETERLHAFLDVTDPEPLPDGHPLWDSPNLTITPHIAGGTHGWQRRGFGLLGDQLRRHAAGEDLVNVVRR